MTHKRLARMPFPVGDSSVPHNAKMGEINPVEAVLSNTDLLTHILKRVPPKPLMAFQIVSKGWLSLISDSHFLNAHTHHLLTTHHQSSISPFQLYCQNTSTSIENDKDYIACLPKLDCLVGLRHDVPNKSPRNILSSCNGLILYQKGKNMPYIVLNPATRKRRLIPEPLGSRGYDPGLTTMLAFDPLISFHYKIIRVFYDRDTDHTVNIDVFSSESGVWKELDFQDPPWIVLADTRQIYWNGAIHWMASPNTHVRFIVDEERFIWDRIATNLNTFPEGGKFGYFGKSDNGLLLIKFSSTESHEGSIESSRYHKDEVLTVLEIDKENIWSLKHQVDLGPLVSEYPEMNQVREDGRRRLKYSVLYVKSGTRNGDFSMILSIPKKAILYEVRKGNGDTGSKVVYEFRYDYRLRLYHDMHPFVGCLAPVL